MAGVEVAVAQAPPTQRHLDERSARVGSM